MKLCSRADRKPFYIDRTRFWVPASPTIPYFPEGDMTDRNRNGRLNDRDFEE